MTKALKPKQVENVIVGMEHSVINKLRDLRNLPQTAESRSAYSDAVEAVYVARAALMNWYKAVDGQT